MSYRIAAVDPTIPEAQSALNAYFNEMAERVDLRFLGEDAAVDADDEGGFFLVALDEKGRVVGCGALRQLSPGVGEIRRMWVNPVMRGRGIGRRLLSAIEGASAVAGLDTLRLHTHENLTEAILMFETSGYIRIEQYDENDFATHWYEKSLIM
jgi:N-acetylglutamate synthase-like GNAT family acetyltransferase